MHASPHAICCRVRGLQNRRTLGRLSAIEMRVVNLRIAWNRSPASGMAPNEQPLYRDTVSYCCLCRHVLTVTNTVRPLSLVAS